MPVIHLIEGRLFQTWSHKLPNKYLMAGKLLIRLSVRPKTKAINLRLIRGAAHDAFSGELATSQLRALMIKFSAMNKKLCILKRKDAPHAIEACN